MTASFLDPRAKTRAGQFRLEVSHFSLPSVWLWFFSELQHLLSQPAHEQLFECPCSRLMPVRAEKAQKQQSPTSWTKPDPHAHRLEKRADFSTSILAGAFATLVIWAWGGCTA